MPGALVLRNAAGLSQEEPVVAIGTAWHLVALKAILLTLWNGRFENGAH